VYNNTFYAINNAVFANTLSEDITSFPYHLGVAWHLAKEPQEIFAIAKKLVDLCALLPPVGEKLKASWRHLDSEVSFCMEKIELQTQLDSYVTELDLARVIAGGNFLQTPDPFGLGRRICSALTQDSVIPAIIIKRH